MNYLKDADERLLTQLQSKKLLLKQQDLKLKHLQQESKKRTSQITNLSQLNEFLSQKHANQIIESNTLYLRLQQTNTILSSQITSLKQTIQYYKTKLLSLQQSKQQEIQNYKNEIELNKTDYTSKIKNLEQNLALLKKTFNVEELIEKDREQIIKDSSKDKDGSIKGVILHSKQLEIELENQSEQIVIMLQKIERGNEMVVKLRREIDIQKQVEVGLVKRSTTAQNLVRQLNQKIKELEVENQSLRRRERERENDKQQNSRSKSIRSTPLLEDPLHQLSTLKTQNNTLFLQTSKLKNQINFLYNKLRLHQTKFQGLATILSQHLQNILLSNTNLSPFSSTSQLPLELNLSELRSKDIVQWKPEETATIIYLLLTQIKPIISKKNLISLPDLKNPNVSMVDETISKETINLPKISTQYNEMMNMEQKKGGRFRGIPLDISTKIVRSELRNWGVKVGMQKKNNKSLSMYSKNVQFM